MKRIAVLVTLAALAACQPSEAPEAPASGMVAEIAPARCDVQVSRDWSAVGSQYYVIEAEARGETCRDAIATFRVESRDGAVLFTRDYPVAQVPLAFNPSNDLSGLRIDLENWLQNTAETERASDLPAWPLRAARPPHFQPAVTRGVYEAARGAQGPLFCYPDGGESNACIAFAGDRATQLGSLTPERE